MKVNQLPLLELFIKLCQAGLPLGIDEYQLVLRALQGGFGIPDREALARLCYALWIKSPNEKLILDDYFDQVIPEKYNFFEEIDLVEKATEDYQQEANIENTKTEEIIQPSNQNTSNQPLGNTQVRRFILNIAQRVTTSISINSAIRLAAFAGAALLIGLALKQISQNKSTVIAQPWPTEIFSPSPTISPIPSVQPQPSTKGNLSSSPGSSNVGQSSTTSPNSAQQSTENNSSTANITPSLTQTSPTFANSSSPSRQLTETNLHQPTQSDTSTQTSIDSQINSTVTSSPIPQSSSSTNSNSDNLQWLFNIGEFLVQYSSIYLILELIILVIFMILYIIRQRLEKDELLTPVMKNLPQENLPRVTSDAAIVQATEDELQFAQTIKQALEESRKSFEGNLFRTTQYFPITQRQMKQGWRYLRRLVREGPQTELDIEATVQEIGQQGFLLKPILLSPRTNRAKLILLADRDGSMLPFHKLSQRLTETARLAGRLGKADIYYFHNCPVQYIYRDSLFQEAELVEDFFKKTDSRQTVVLLFSDAGAARGSFNPERAELTKQFLNQLRQKIRYIAWLNPMPRKRWVDTTAEEIAQFIPMFEVSRQGFQSAINVLRGR